MVSAGRLVSLQVFAVLLTGEVSRGQLFGQPVQQTLQEFIGRPPSYGTTGYSAREPAGYGPPKPYLPVVRKVVSDGDKSSDYGENPQESPEYGKESGKESKEFGRVGAGAEHLGDAEEDGTSEADYASLKQAAVKTLRKNAYGFKHNPKKFRNKLREDIVKYPVNSKKQYDHSSESANDVSEKSSDLFSQPDWPDWPQGTEDKSGNRISGAAADGFEAGGFFGEEYRIEADHSRSNNDEHRGPVQLEQRHGDRDRHNRPHDLTNMLNFESSRSHGADSDNYSKHRDFGPAQENDARSHEFEDPRPGFGPPKEFAESGELASHQERGRQYNDFETQKAVGISKDYSSSNDFGGNGIQPTSRDFSQGRPFEPGHHQDGRSGSEKSSYSDLETTGGSYKDQDIQEEVKFEPQRTSNGHREGYNTPKPYKPPSPTTAVPRHGLYPLSRPAYRPEHGGRAYLRPEHVPGGYGPSEHSLLSYNAAKHARDAHGQTLPGYGGYVSGYGPYGYGYRAPQRPYSGTAVHPDQHRHTGGGYRAGYSPGYSPSQPEDVRLYQITQPLHPDHSPADDYADHGYGLDDYASPGYATPGYVSLDYVPAGRDYGYASAAGGGYGPSRPDFGAGNGLLYYGDYGLPRYGGRPYRRADGGAAAGRRGGAAAAGSEPVAAVVAAPLEQTPTAPPTPTPTPTAAAAGTTQTTETPNTAGDQGD